MAVDVDPPLLRDLLRFKPRTLTPNGWAVKAGVSRNVWSDIRRHGNPSRRTLEKLLGAAGTNLAEFEALRIGGVGPVEHGSRTTELAEPNSAAWRAAPSARIPLIATAPIGGAAETGFERFLIMTEQRIGEIERPASLSRDRDAFAFEIVGKSMWPRFRPGRNLIVSPLAPIATGDDMLIIFPASDLGQTAILGELVGRSDDGVVELRQFNPDLTFSVDAPGIASMHKVIGEAI